MKTLMTKAVLGLTLGATALAVATPASAQHYGYGGGHHGGGGGGAVVAGIAGLAIGAAIAGSNNRYRGGYGYNYAPPRGYYNGYNAYNGYNGYNGYDRYYADPRYRNDAYDNYRRCWTEQRYDPYYGSSRIQVCD